MGPESIRPEFIYPSWPAPASVHALVTTRACGDLKGEEGRLRLRAHLPADPIWLQQVHGADVIHLSPGSAGAPADGTFTRQKNIVCAVMAADCMPVLLAHDTGEAVGIAHAGWRGLAAGVLEAAVAAIGLPGDRILAWLGPAIGPDAYEVGADVRAAFLDHDVRAAAAFSPTRPGHWRLDLYAVARQRLAAQGVGRIYGGGFCTFTEKDRFFSYRRDRTASRMAAAIWLA